jgi:uracil-DNA glycosylase
MAEKNFAMLSEIVERIRSERPTSQVPGFDPKNGNEQASFLFLLEAPGPKAVKTGLISYDNPDLTASNFRNQLQAAGIGPEKIALWNIVPWYLGNSDKSRIRGAAWSDISGCLSYLPHVISCMPNLRCIVLVGAAARRAHVYLSGITTARILSCHHPSPKVMNNNPKAAEENIAVFRFMQQFA